MLCRGRREGLDLDLRLPKNARSSWWWLESWEGELLPLYLYIYILNIYEKQDKYDIMFYFSFDILILAHPPLYLN